MENMLRLGPKEMKGSIWDEGGGTTIVQILISHRHYQIDSIQFLYAVNGKVFRSEIRGELTGLKFDMVSINYHARPSNHLSLTFIELKTVVIFVYIKM